ncbi:NAD-dependent protein deacetylase [Noviherbaspirillum massiliense]|uniref:NAD-dependent protein deacetylase n=1 Tax=Noviherbaspirillum massiliense TaxID=1465823 RepID=UPI00031BC0E9|nr:NAD-dependent protein deacetylase [Noviherbaspirillum massiliense]
MYSQIFETRGIAELASFIERHARVLVLTGAGMSTASGIPDYRDRDGVRRGKAPIQGPEFRTSDAVRKRYWARSMVGWPVLAQARPNPGHRALAALEAEGRIAALVTQNVDGLHRHAGSNSLVELHGNIHLVACLECGARISREFMQELLEEANPHMANASAMPAPDGDAHLEPEYLEDFHVPHCPHCAGMLMPDVVFFGDGVPRARTEQVNRQLERADAVLVVGSSLMVFSGYRLCRDAAVSGKPVAAVNMGKTRADHLLSLKVEERSEYALPLLAALLSSG